MRSKAPGRRGRVPAVGAHAEEVPQGQRPTRQVDIVDETFVVAPPHVLAAVFTDPRNVATVWPHVTATMTLDRGELGALWAVHGLLDGEFEVWIQPWWDGAIVHHYVRATTAADPKAVERAHVHRWKRFVTAVKDRLEPERRTWSFGGGQSALPLGAPGVRRPPGRPASG